MSISKTKNGKSISHLLVTFISFGLFVYFFYHLMHGDRGYFAWKGVEEKLKTSQIEYEKAVSEREALENRVKRLRPDSLDPDLLDEQARRVLGFIKPEEIVVLENKS
jgi:cell division protein FtsB